MLPKVKRTKSPEQALSALMRMAARAERSSGDALRLMRSWGVEPAAQRAVLQKLTDMRFIDDVRYAEAFVRDKLRLSGWGAYKIRAALKAKGIAAGTIDDALAQIDPEAARQRLLDALARKRRTLKAADNRELRNKLMRYGASLGYDFASVAEAVAQTVKTEEEWSEF